jgi:hypothetical protein
MSFSRVKEISFAAGKVFSNNPATTARWRDTHIAYTGPSTCPSNGRLFVGETRYAQGVVSSALAL